MIQCKDCEFCEMGTDGKRFFKCDPFVNIKEPECIAKWQLIRLDMLLSNHQSMLRFQERFAPMQDKLFKYMQHEIDNLDESERWRLGDDAGDEDGPTQP